MWVWEIKQKPGSEVNPCSFKLRTSDSRMFWLHIAWEGNIVWRGIYSEDRRIPGWKIHFLFLRAHANIYFNSIIKSEFSLTLWELPFRRRILYLSLDAWAKFHSQMEDQSEPLQLCLSNTWSYQENELQSLCDYLEQIRSLWSVCWSNFRFRFSHKITM